MSWIEDPGVSWFRGLDLTSLGVDEAFVNITSEIPKLWLYSLSSECYKCPYSRVSAIEEIQEPLKRSTRFPEKWRLLSDGSLPIIPAVNHSAVVCEVDVNLGEFGVYDLWIHDEGGEILCEFNTMLKPVNIYLPLVICTLGLLFLWVACAAVTAGVNKWKQSKKSTISPIGHELESTDDKDKNNSSKLSNSRKRVKALDTFRGISIILMIFINYGAGSYAVLEHATWNGLQLADVVFPWFMWIMGVCIPISVTSQMRRNVSRFKMLAEVLRRSCILFLLGVMLNTLGKGSHIDTIRIFGVLQRFGVVYFVVATIFICFSCRHCNTPKVKCVAALQDILLLLPQWIIISAFVAGHCALTFLLPIPGCPLGYMGPGGNHENAQYKNCSGGAVGYVDHFVLGIQHLYQNPTSSEIYAAGPFDPEGIVGCLTSAFQVFLGVQAGMIIVQHQGWKGRLIRWLIWGTLSGIGGTVLCLASKEDGWIPLNKNLWSVSFVLVTSCFAFYLLGICYVLIDVKNWWSGFPFIFPGMNATIMYVGHSIAYNLFPWRWSYGLMNTHFMLLVENIWGTLLWIVIAYWLHQKKFYLTI